MKTKLSKYILLTIMCILGLTLSLSIPTFADNPNPCDPSLPNAVLEYNGCNNNENKLPSIITNILNAIIGISGIIAVIYVIIGGINYMTSNGDSAKTQKAKNTILYALIGLAICALAFAIVNWAIGAIGNANKP